MVKLDPKKLAELCKRSTAMLAPWRETRANLAREVAGPLYGKPGAGQPQPLPLLFQAYRSTVRQLVMQTPEALIRPKSAGDGKAEFTGKLLAGAWNLMAKEINLGDSLRLAAVNALCGPAVVNVGVCKSPAAPLSDPGGYLHDANQPFCDVVDLDNYVCDMEATVREAMRYEGHDWWGDREALSDSGLYDPDAITRLADMQGNERGLADMTVGQQPADGREYVRMRSLWLPAENLVVEMPGEPDQAGNEFLRVIEWDGPERGPYEMLGFYWVPGNLLPVAYLAVLKHLHDAANKAARKQGRQADRQKDILLFDKSATEEAETVKDSSDGEAVGVQNVDRYRQVSLGGTNPDGYRYLDAIQQAFSKAAGNLDLRSGSEATSGTLGQDQMLMGQAMGDINDMRVQFAQFANRVGERLAWYLWYDQEKQPEVTTTTSDGGQPIRARFDEAAREGDFLDFQFDIDVYSMAPESPETKYGKLVNWLAQIILPISPLAQQMGMTLDPSKIARLGAEYLHMPEVGDIYTATMPMQADPIQGQGQPGGQQDNRTSSGQGNNGQAAQAPQREPEALSA